MPVPEAPAVTVIQPTLLAAVQLQPLPVVTVTVPDAATADVRFDDPGEIRKVQDAPAWVTVNVCPPMVSVPAR